MKKTTILIDEVLLSQAMQAVNARSKKEAITAGLKSLIKTKNRESLRRELGTFDLDLDLKKLTELRNAD